MLKLDMTNEAIAFLNILPGKQFKQIVSMVFDLLKNPFPQDSRVLNGYPYRRVDFGEYRVVYQVNDESLQILVIGKRNDDEVYKKLARKKQGNKLI